MIASVIINVSSSNVDQKYDYFVPTELESLITIGGRVKVNFGNGDRTIMGYVVALAEQSSFDGELKSVVEVVDVEPIITSNQFTLAKYVAYDSVSLLVRVLNMMIPEAMQLKTVKYLTVVDYQALDAEIAVLFGGKQIIEYSSNMYVYHNKIKKAIEKGLLLLSYDAVSKTNDRYIEKYSLDLDYYFKKGSTLSPYLSDTLKLMIDEVPLTVNELVDKFDLSIYMVRSLIKRNFFKKTLEKVNRIKEISIPTFVKYQEKELNKVKDTFTKLIDKENIPHLWIPKDTEETDLIIYSLLYHYITNKKRVVVIVPDILASYKFASIIRKMTNSSVACLNSSLSKGEYLDYYNEIKKDQYDIIVTTSFGSLLPFNNVGLYLLINTENDNYFNDQSPRYDLKKVMIQRSKIENTNIIMHSYCPTITEYCRGLQSNYLMIDNRIDGDSVNTEVVDMKTELASGNDSYLSTRLIRKIKITKALNKQTVLIINNKNYSSAVICRSCGFIHKCPRCELTLKYSKKNNLLSCPVCSYKIPYEDVCPKCQSTNLRLTGIGMEQIMEELTKLLPSYKTVMIDSVLMSDFQDKIIDVEEQKVDIIITTDTYARSIFDLHIGLVGIINIDSIANSTNYNANERAYNLLINSSSLIKHNPEGTLLIQTYHTENEILHDFIKGDYKAYLKKEISIRKILKNEPFYFINRIFVKAKYEEMFVEADLIKKILKEMLQEKVFIVGPIYNRTQMAAQIIVKHRLENISEYYQKIYEQYQNSDVKVIFDKYPKYL